MIDMGESLSSSFSLFVEVLLSCAVCGIKISGIIPLVPTKGQLISKCLFGVSNSPKKRT